MTTEEKCKEILEQIISRINSRADDDVPDENRYFKFEHDWGHGTVTVVDRGSHSHCAGDNFDQLVDNMHRLICKNTGLSGLNPAVEVVRDYSKTGAQSARLFS